MIDVLRNQSDSWKEIIFDKVADFTGAKVGDTTIETRNEKLIEKWLLPKLASSLRFTKINESKERVVKISFPFIAKIAKYNFFVSTYHRNKI